MKTKQMIRLWQITVMLLLLGFGTVAQVHAHEIRPALPLFNVGVEIGQVFFVFLILALLRSFKVLEIHWPRWVQWMPGYEVGSLGAFRTIQRTVMLFTVA